MLNSFKNVGWSIGNYCNAKCKHCYSWKKRKESSEILTLAEVDIIIDKLIDYGVTTINFGGNEPIFTNGPDLSKTMLPYIINRISSVGIKCGITTNGFTFKYLYENYLEEFIKVVDWDFSLDAFCREEHDSNRNHKGLFDNVIKSIEICKRQNIHCSIVIAGMKSNLTTSSLDGFIALAKQYDVELRINLLKPTQKSHFELFPSSEQVYEAFRYLASNTNFISLSEPVIAVQMGLATNGCPCGINSFRIRSKINNRVPVTPCVYLDLDAGDILTTSIDDIVNSSTFKDFRKRNNDFPQKCKEKNCKVIDRCRGGCNARTILVTNDINESDPYCIYNSKFQPSEYNTPSFIFKEKDDCVRVHENYLCTWIGCPKNH